MNDIIRNTTPYRDETLKTFINTKDDFNLNSLPTEKPAVITFTGYVIVNVTSQNGNFTKIVFDEKEGKCFTSSKVFLDAFEKMRDDVDDRLADGREVSIEVSRLHSKTNPERVYLTCQPMVEFGNVVPF